MVVCGDFNCHVGLKPDYIVCDRITVNIDNIDYNTRHAVPRVSEDKAGNGQGTKLLDIRNATKLRIVNGRLGEDRYRGAFT